MIRNAVSGCFVVVFLSAIFSHAEVRLPRLFTDHMVLQQGTSVPVWGWADDGEKVTVEFAGQKHSTTAKNGRWLVKLRRMDANASSQVLKISGDSKGKHSLVQVNDVLIGEVWIASGQSNMEWSLGRSYEPTNDIKSATNPYIRLFTVPKLKLNDPTNDVNGQWQYCTPETVPSFSAVAYYFGRDLQKALNVPIGLIHTSWGGSPAEVWISEEVLLSTCRSA
jgi:sialate O-acetylesterase